MKALLGLFLLGIIIILTLTALYALFVRNEKRKRTKYDNAYATLQFLVNYGIDDRVTCKNMRQMFNEIADMPYCNREKCQVLEQEFYRKFKNAKNGKE